MPWPKGKKQSPETIAKRKITFAKPEVKEKMRESAKRRKPPTPEQRAKQAAALRGRKRPLEVVEKVRKALKGRKPTEEERQKVSEGMKKKWQDPAYRKQMRLAHSGPRPNRKGIKFSKEAKEHMSKAHIGKGRSPESCLKQGTSISGEKHFNWKGGPLPSNHRGKGWHTIKRLVRERAKNLCEVCGTGQNFSGWKLDVHHVIPYRLNGVSSIDNCIAVCRKCHIKLDRGIMAPPPNGST